MGQVHSNPYASSFKSKKQIEEDGHIDKPSAIRKLKVSIENAQAIIDKLESSGDNQELMSWWMDKVTLANDYLSKAKDFINNPSKETEQDNIYNYERLHYT